MILLLHPTNAHVRCFACGCLQAVPAHTKAVVDCVWVPFTNLVVSTSLDGTIKVWDAEYG